MNSVVFTMIYHPGNTYVIDFTMNNVVFTMIWDASNTYIIDFTVNSFVFTMKNTLFCLGGGARGGRK